jgi:hypothetical protein
MFWELLRTDRSGSCLLVCSLVELSILSLALFLSLPVSWKSNLNEEDMTLASHAATEEYVHVRVEIMFLFFISFIS